MHNSITCVRSSIRLSGALSALFLAACGAGAASSTQSTAPRAELAPAQASIETVQVKLSSSSSPLSIARPALYPETIVVNPRTGKFLVSSIREGAVFEIEPDGSSRKVVQDDRLTSVLGIAVDAANNRLVVTNSDLGAGVRRSARGVRREAGVAVYALDSGEALRYVDLTPLAGEGEHLMNGITLDAQGNAYVTDSFAPIIYKVSSDGTASVFLTHEEFRGNGINLNGIVYHPDGFLLAVKKSSGTLYRIPLDQPQQFTRIQVPTQFFGGDGLLLLGGAQLVLVANKTPEAISNTAFVLRSDDGWSSARVLESRDLGNVYPTTATAFEDKIYLLSSHLDEWLTAKDEMREAIANQARRAEIQEIGAVTR